MDKLKIYQWVPSPSAEKARRAIHHKAGTFEAVDVNFFDRANLVAKSGQNLIPILEHGSKVIGPNSFSVVEYVETALQGTTLFPDNSHGLCKIVDDHVEANINLGIRTFAPVFIQLMCTDAQKTAFFADIMKRRGVIKSSLDEVNQEHGAGFPNLKKEAQPFWKAFDEHFATRKFFLGDKMSAADHSIYSHYWFANINPAWQAVQASFGFKHLEAWANRQKDFYFTKLG